MHDIREEAFQGGHANHHFLVLQNLGGSLVRKFYASYSKTKGLLVLGCGNLKMTNITHSEV